MGTGIWENFHWESGIWVTGTGIWSLGMGITDRKTIELGLRFLKFGKTICWENGIYTPPSEPSFNETLKLLFVTKKSSLSDINTRRMRFSHVLFL